VGFVGLGCLWGWFGCLLGTSLGFRVVPCEFVWFFFCELALVVPVYTPGVLRSALRFL
jgi:hypothetical protein